jgi:hypothetical protein
MKNNIINNKKNNLLVLRINELFSIHRTLVYIAIVIFIAHCTAMIFKYSFGNDILFGLVPLFDFYEEKNVPTYFSSISLLFTSGLIFLIVGLKKSFKTSDLVAWKVLGWGFFLMSIDELADIRMILKNIGMYASNKEALDAAASVGFSVAWTIPIAILLIFLGFYFLPFLRSLKMVYTINFALAGAAFVFGAVVIENIEGFHIAETGGVRDFKFMIMVTIEETLEISSILYFQYFLIKYIKEYFSDSAALIFE